jgi:hypothetical protein
MGSSELTQKFKNYQPHREGEEMWGDRRDDGRRKKQIKAYLDVYYDEEDEEVITVLHTCV